MKINTILTQNNKIYFTNDNRICLEIFITTNLLLTENGNILLMIQQQLMNMEMLTT